MEIRKLTMIVKLAHERMNGWASLYALYLEYYGDPFGVDVLDLIIQEMNDYEKKLFKMDWKMVEPGRWVYVGQYQQEVYMIETSLGTPISEVNNDH